MMGCTSEEQSIITSRENSNEVKSQYQYFKGIEITKKSDILHNMGISDTRNTETNLYELDFISYLASLSEQQIDSLANLYCTPQLEERAINQYISSIEKLTEMTSCMDVESLFSFIDNYISIGGHSLDELTIAVEDKPEIISLCMIKAAASIDVILSQNINTRTSKTDCINKLTVGVAGNFATTAIEEAIEMSTSAIPVVDVATSLIIVGVDCYLALKSAQDFQHCMRGVPESIK